MAENDLDFLIFLPPSLKSGSTSCFCGAEGNPGLCAYGASTLPTETHPEAPVHMSHGPERQRKWGP